MSDVGRKSDAEFEPEGLPREERRQFLKKAGKVAVTAPAVALLLSIAGKRADADTAPAPSGLQTDTFAGPPI